MNKKEDPPAKNYGGADMVTYFTQLLFDETLTMFYVNYRSRVDASNLFSQAQQILDMGEKTEQDLKANGSYFYPDGGSVFMDYKSARERAFPKDGSLREWRQEHIRLDMSSQEAFEECRKQVEQWWKKTN